MLFDILGQPIPTASPEEAKAALRTLGVNNLADIDAGDLGTCAAEIDEISGEDTPRCLRWFWAWVGALAACIIGGAVTATWMTGWWSTLESYKLAMALNDTCLIAMAALLAVAVWWKGTIRCENAACIWLAGCAAKCRERLEQEE